MDKVITDVERTEQVLKNTLHQIIRYADKKSSIEIEYHVEQKTSASKLQFKMNFSGKMKTELDI